MPLLLTAASLRDVGGCGCRFPGWERERGALDCCELLACRSAAPTAWAFCRRTPFPHKVPQTRCLKTADMGAPSCAERRSGIGVSAGPHSHWRLRQHSDGPRLAPQGAGSPCVPGLVEASLQSCPLVTAIFPSVCAPSCEGLSPGVSVTSLQRVTSTQTPFQMWLTCGGPGGSGSRARLLGPSPTPNTCLVDGTNTALSAAVRHLSQQLCHVRAGGGSE